MSYANGTYSATFGGFVAAGTYSFDNAGGGPDVGTLSTQLTVPAPLAWPDVQSFITVNRTSGVTVNWTGADPGSYVTISGLSVGRGTSGSLYGYFTCTAAASAGTFTVPATVLQSLPPSIVREGIPAPTLTVSNTTKAQSFTASGIDQGSVQATFAFTKQLTYQ
jgi:hypothetical protein